MEVKNNNSKAEAFQAGMIVLILLAVLTIGEFFIGAIAFEWAAALWLIAILKAWLVLRDYMHVHRVFGEEEESH